MAIFLEDVYLRICPRMLLLLWIQYHNFEVWICSCQVANLWPRFNTVTVAFARWYPSTSMVPSFITACSDASVMWLGGNARPASLQCLLHHLGLCDDPQNSPWVIVSHGLSFTEHKDKDSAKLLWLIKCPALVTNRAIFISSLSSYSMTSRSTGPASFKALCLKTSWNNRKRILDGPCPSSWPSKPAFAASRAKTSLSVEPAKRFWIGLGYSDDCHMTMRIPSLVHHHIGIFLWTCNEGWQRVAMLICLAWSTFGASCASEDARQWLYIVLFVLPLPSPLSWMRPSHLCNEINTNHAQSCWKEHAGQHENKSWKPWKVTKTRQRSACSAWLLSSCNLHEMQQDPQGVVTKIAQAWKGAQRLDLTRRKTMTWTTPCICCLAPPVKVHDISLWGQSEAIHNPLDVSGVGRLNAREQHQIKAAWWLMATRFPTISA